MEQWDQMATEYLYGVADMGALNPSITRRLPSIYYYVSFILVCVLFVDVMGAAIPTKYVFDFTVSLDEPSIP